MKTLRCSVIHSLIVAALGMSLAAPLLAQSDVAAPAGPAPVSAAQGISPEAKAVLDRMKAHMLSLQDFSIEAVGSRDEVLASGYKLQHNEHANLVVQRPNRMRAEVSGDLRNRTFVYDAGKMVLYSPDDDAYARFVAPDTLKELIGSLLESGVDLPLIDVLYQAADGALTAQVSNGLVVGDATIDGVPCDHLAFRQSNADWQLWVAKGDKPLPRKIVITTRDTSDPQFIATLSWNLKPAIEASTFSFVPPKGATEIPYAKATAVAADAQ